MINIYLFHKLLYSCSKP